MWIPNTAAELEEAPRDGLLRERTRFELKRELGQAEVARLYERRLSPAVDRDEIPQTDHSIPPRAARRTDWSLIRPLARLSDHSARGRANPPIRCAPPRPLNPRLGHVRFRRDCTSRESVYCS